MPCVDPDGHDDPLSCCGECTSSERRCAGGLQTCTTGRWSMPEDCTLTSGWRCFDPAPAGGSDAYCGLCLVGATQCRGDDLDQCNAQGTGSTSAATCSWGCNPATLGRCGAPDCSGLLCGGAPSTPAVGAAHAGCPVNAAGCGSVCCVGVRCCFGQCSHACD